MARGGGKSRGTGGKRKIPRKPAGSALARKRPKHSRFGGAAQKGNGAPGQMDFLARRRLRDFLVRRKALAPDLKL